MTASIRRTHFVVGLVVATTLAVAPAASAQPTITIGGPDNIGAMLERPRDILVLSNRIIVVENGAPFLKVFDFNGRLLQSAGRLGAGPGEMRYIATTAVNAASNELLVFDTPLGRLTRFDVGDTLSFRSSQLLTLQVEGACVAAGRVFGTAYSNSRIAHELVRQDPEVRVIRSFGDALTSHPLAQHQMFKQYLADGPAACAAATQEVIVASALVGIAQIVALDGSAQRTVVLDGFQPVVITGVPGGLQFADPPAGSHDVVVDVRAEPDFTVFTVGRVNREFRGAGEYATYREIVIDRNDRQTVGRESEWRTFHSTPQRTVCFRSAPEPEIAIVAGPTCP